MGRTIVQDYGPIYGEPVNGTVQGRPNGSVYVPITNTMTLSVPEELDHFVYTDAGYIWIVKSDGAATTYGVSIVAESQDLASSIVIELYDDEELTNLIGYRDMGAGLFNWPSVRAFPKVGDPTTETTIYLRTRLMNNGTPVATSDVYTLEAYTP